MKKRYVSVQLLLNKDGSMKAQRIYEIPEPSVVSAYFKGWEPMTGENVLLGCIYQEWNSPHDILEYHPDRERLLATLERRFGIAAWDSSLGF